MVLVMTMIAQDFHYHKLCITNYLCSKPKRSESEGSRHLYEEEMEWLCGDIKEPLKKGAVFFVTYLANKYKMWLKEHGLKEAENYPSHCFKC